MEGGRKGEGRLGGREVEEAGRGKGGRERGEGKGGKERREGEGMDGAWRGMEYWSIELTQVGISAYEEGEGGESEI
ncbi:hypothetical protein JAAARDRAFT_489809 [Jaapia argillacea MUCL 33604]|uniref:Uncharacterized protein n=1 Tax=Jaapia argillacea MUCL 33604 TaxID=933084 RepID=A0A067PBH2_9AGAM|nr:hypothetical protein JAAARDRAFT_489809 [Jaapia argillacea MUCL 33604]